MTDEERSDSPDAERPEDEAPRDEAPEGDAAPETGSAAPEEPAAPDEPAPAEEPVAESSDAEAPAEEPAPEIGGAEELAEAAERAAPEADEAAEPPRERPRPRRGKKGERTGEEVIPGAHLEPDLVLEEEGREVEELGYPGAEPEAEQPEPPEEPQAAEEREPEAAPVAREPIDLAADARYHATGKRKTAVARVILRPGEGSYSVNGEPLDLYFPRIKLQKVARQPLETAGYQRRLDVVARIQGGGVAAQAGALRHGVARALVEADPNLRLELKRRGFLTRDPRQKERKKAGLKKARKRPQFSKR